MPIRVALRRFARSGQGRVACGLLVLATVAEARAQTPAQPAAQAPITLEEVERLALEQHPDLAGSTAGVDIARGQARQAGAWPNPTVGYEAEDLGGGHIEDEHGFFIEQDIPLGGKLRLSRQALDAAVTEAEQSAALARLIVLTRVRTAYIQVLASQLRVDVRERLARLASEATDVSTQLFNVGAADRPDVLASEMEAALVRVELTDARNRLARSWAQLAAAIGRSDLPQRPVDGNLDTPLPELPRDQTLRAALESHPELAALRASNTRAERELALARRQTFPDLQVRIGPHHDASQGDPVFDPAGWQWNVTAGLTVPLWNRNRGGVAAAQARVVQVRAEGQALELRLRDRFAAEYEQYLSAIRRAEVYRAEILPRANESYRLYLDKYRQMAAAYPQVLLTQRTLFEVTDRYLEAVEQVRTSAIALQALVSREESR